MKDYNLHINRVLVTGGSGFIARHLVQTLKDLGIEVVQLNRQAKIAENIFSSADYVQENITFADFGKIDLIFHLAAVYSPNSDSATFIEMFKSNVQLSSKMIFDANAHSVPILLTGSYTQSANGQDFNSMTLYASFKNAVEIMADYFVKSQGLKCATTRIYESYGYDDKRPKLLYRIIDALLTNTEITLPEADLELNYVEVNDLVNALIEIGSKIATNENFTIYRISPASTIKLSEIITLLESIVGRSLKKSNLINSRSHFDVKQTWLSGEVIPNWIPHHVIDQDLDRLVANRRVMLDQSGAS
jgi:nucleoside-diphosphate-sugar epimerase